MVAQNRIGFFIHKTTRLLSVYYIYACSPSQTITKFLRNCWGFLKILTLWCHVISVGATPKKHCLGLNRIVWIVVRSNQLTYQVNRRLPKEELKLGIYRKVLSVYSNTLASLYKIAPMFDTYEDLRTLSSVQNFFSIGQKSVLYERWPKIVCSHWETDPSLALYAALPSMQVILPTFRRTQSNALFTRTYGPTAWTWLCVRLMAVNQTTESRPPGK